MQGRIRMSQNCIQEKIFLIKNIFSILSWKMLYIQSHSAFIDVTITVVLLSFLFLRKLCFWSQLEPCAYVSFGRAAQKTRANLKFKLSSKLICLHLTCVEGFILNEVLKECPLGKPDKNWGILDAHALIIKATNRKIKNKAKSKESKICLCGCWMAVQEHPRHLGNGTYIFFCRSVMIKYQ